MVPLPFYWIELSESFSASSSWSWLLFELKQQEHNIESPRYHPRILHLFGWAHCTDSLCSRLFARCPYLDVSSSSHKLFPPIHKMWKHKYAKQQLWMQPTIGKSHSEPTQSSLNPQPTKVSLLDFDFLLINHSDLFVPEQVVECTPIVSHHEWPCQWRRWRQYRWHGEKGEEIFKLQNRKSLSVSLKQILVTSFSCWLVVCECLCACNCVTVVRMISFEHSNKRTHN